MERSRLRMVWFGVATGAAMIGVLLAFALDPVPRPRQPIALLAAAATLEATVSVLAWVRYRDSGDPGPLLICVGFAALALQTALFGMLWPMTLGRQQIFADTQGTSGAASAPFGGRYEATSVLGWQTGWFVAAGAFVLARPWWERRGRPPIRPVSAFIVAAAALILIDGVLLRIRPDRFPSTSGSGFLRELPGVIAAPAARPAGWVLAVLTIGLLGLAAWREHRSAEVDPEPSSWLAAAFVLAIPVQVAVARHPTEGLPWVQWADVLQPAVATLAFAGLLVHERTEISRMRRASDRAEEVMEGRAEIAAMVSHEVRGPVSTIRGLASTARNQYERLSEDERREFLEMIELESDRLLDTATQASLGLKVDAATLVYDLRPQQLEPAILAGVTAAAVGDHPITIEIQPGVEAVVDRKWFAEVIHQLIDNACKFSPEDAPIEVSARAEGPEIIVEVADRGPGIPPEHRDTVFEKFASWRPDGYSQAAGSGLGLFIARGIVTAHKGTVIPADREGGGTMLRIRLPRREG